MSKDYTCRQTLEADIAQLPAHMVIRIDEQVSANMGLSQDSAIRKNNKLTKQRLRTYIKTNRLGSMLKNVPVIHKETARPNIWDGI